MNIIERNNFCVGEESHIIYIHVNVEYTQL